MSELPTKVKVNLQEKYFELEGSEEFVTEMTEQIKEMFETSPVSKPKKDSKKDDKDSDKKSKRGGKRSSVISPAIDKMIDDGWYDEFKTIAETVTELKRISVPGVNSINVGMALSRRVPDKLDRIKNNDGKWTYRKK